MLAWRSRSHLVTREPRIQIVATIAPGRESVQHFDAADARLKLLLGAAVSANITAWRARYERDA